jgi:hypothetical protein
LLAVQGGDRVERHRCQDRLGSHRCSASFGGLSDGPQPPFTCQVTPLHRARERARTDVLLTVPLQGRPLTTRTPRYRRARHASSR